MDPLQPAFISPSTAAAERLLADLGQAFQLEPAEPLRFDHGFCDSFDWALYRAGWALEIAGARHRLLDLTTGEVLAQAEESAVHAPRFAWDFADPELRDRLAATIKLRALIRLVAVRGTGRRFTLRDAQGQLVGRCDLLSLHVVRGKRSRPLAAWCGLGRQVRTPALRGIVARLRDDPAWRDAPPTLLEAALERVQITPGGYTGKVRLRLSPQLSAAEAARRIAASLLQTMRANLPGIRQDVDTEFLHDFRVAVRRTRSLLKLLQDVFPPAPAAEFAAAFQQLGRLTGPLRDLDVYLLKRREFGATLPPRLQPGLGDYFAGLAERRRRAWREVVTQLDDPALERTLQAWEDFLALEPERWDPLPARAARPIAEVARRKIAKSFERILRDGSRIRPGTRDRALHRLRIRCKQLRYALEFFASLYPGGAVGQLLRQLKLLQDNLGEFNDLSVQLAHLHQVLDDTVGPAPTVPEAASLGAMILQLHARKQTVRREFAAAFAAFSAKPNRKLVGRLLG